MKPLFFEIGHTQLVIAASFMLGAGGLSLFLKLQMEKSILIATVRTYLQLFVLGYVLRWVFTRESYWVVLGIILFMMLFANWTIKKRGRNAPGGISIESFLSLFISGVTVIFAVTAVIIHVRPWYLPQYVIPISGMVIGNSMNGVALSLEAMFGDMKKREDEVNLMLGLGASPWEASLPSIRHAIYSGLIPTINSMMTVGVVHIPGVMTGQILAGVDPASAAYYQIVIMLMISAATSLASILSLLLTYGRIFNGESMLVVREENELQ